MSGKSVQSIKFGLPTQRIPASRNLAYCEMKAALEQAVQRRAAVGQRATVGGGVEKVKCRRLLGFRIVEVEP